MFPRQGHSYEALLSGGIKRRRNGEQTMTRHKYTVAILYIQTEKSCNRLCLEKVSTKRYLVGCGSINSSPSSRKHAYMFDPLRPHFYKVKAGVNRGIHYFSYFCSKHRLWVLVRTASAISMISVLSRNMKNYQSFYPIFFSFFR